MTDESDNDDLDFLNAEPSLVPSEPLWTVVAKRGLPGKVGAYKKVRNQKGTSPYRAFDTPEELWTACVDYFRWVDDNPLYHVKAFSHQGVVVRARLPKMRAMTKTAMCLHIGLTAGSLNKYGTQPEFKEFHAVVQAAYDVIYAQKFEGAAADLFNANLIARDLGLKEQSETDITTGGKPIASPTKITIRALPANKKKPAKKK